jgi:hypothetical protein
MANLRGTERIDNNTVLFPLVLLTSKTFKALYKILCLPISLWERQVLLSPYKGGGEKEHRFASFMPSEAKYFVKYLKWDLKIEKPGERGLEEFVIEGHNFTPRKCLESVNIVNLHFQWSGMKALNCFNAPHPANSNFGFRKSSTQSEVVQWKWSWWGFCT